MSTILDALRKVEEETRTQNADARTRLLSATQRFDFRTPRRQRIPWMWAAGCILAGIVLGAGVLLFGSWESLPPQVALVETIEQPSTDTKPVSPEQGQPLETPPLPTNALPSKAAPPVPAAESQSAVVPAGASYSAWGAKAQQDLHTYVPPPPQPPPSEALVQKSPFVAAPPLNPIVEPPAGRGTRFQHPQMNRHRAAVAQSPVPQPATVATPEPTAVVDAPIEESSIPEAASGEEKTAPPDTSLTFLQWSSEPNKRIASIKVGNGPSTLAHEGDAIGDMTVVEIRPDAVELRSGNSHYTLKAQ
ncbi:MAG: hypothetical protein AB7G75_13265 [Candidatus Binatia bacterium]